MVQALIARIQSESERVERARAEFNFRSIEPLLPQGSQVLDVGAWTCYLGEILRDRKGCGVLSVDVTDANRTGMPFRRFDGKTIPAESRTYDVVLLLYVLHHAKEDKPLLHECGRVLRDGGRLLVAEDCVDGFWDKVLTHGFHVWLWLITRMTRDGKFRTTAQWQTHFRNEGFHIRHTISLGHHLGRSLWPNNVLFVLEKAEGAEFRATEAAAARP